MGSGLRLPHGYGSFSQRGVKPDVRPGSMYRAPVLGSPSHTTSAVKGHGCICALENHGVKPRPSHLPPTPHPPPLLLIAPTSGILLAPPCVFYVFIFIFIVIVIVIFFYLKIVFLSVLLPLTCILCPAEETATCVDSGMLETGLQSWPIHTLSQGRLMLHPHWRV